MSTEDNRKIWEFRINGEREWVAAPTMLIAIREYLNITDISFYDIDDKDEVVEVPKRKWSKMKVTDESGIVLLTFEQWMKCNKGNDIIATTNF